MLWILQGVNNVPIVMWSGNKEYFHENMNYTNQIEIIYIRPLSFYF